MTEHYHYPATNSTPETDSTGYSDNETDVNPNELRRLIDHALQYGTTEELMGLFDDGMDVDQEDFQGRTPIMVLTAQGRVEAAKVVLERGADLNRVFMYQGRLPFTALDAARQTGRADLVELFTLHGAKSGRDVLAEQTAETQ